MTTATQPKIETKEYKVAAVSSNTQSFGHRSYILLGRDGQGLNGLRIDGSMRGDPIDRFKQGDTITFQVGKDGRPNKGLEHGFELFQDKPNAPKDVVEQVWRPDFPNNRK